MILQRAIFWFLFLGSEKGCDEKECHLLFDEFMVSICRSH